MWKYVVRRLVWLPILLFAVSLITFFLFQIVPGDPVRVRLGNRYNPDSAVTQNLRRDLGLDRPFFVQYGSYMWGFVRGDFGESFRFPNQPVRGIIVRKMWVSAQLTLAALAISIGIGLPLGFFVAHKQGSWLDPSVVTSSLVLMSILPMLSVPALLWVLCLKLHWVPCSGSPWEGFFHPRIVVPAIAMGVPGIAGFVRLMRASTLDVFGQDFIRTARAKGLTTFRIDTRHVLRNAMIPIVTVLAFTLAGLVSGALVVENIMGVPGIGLFALDSVFNRDYPVVMAIALITATFFVLATLLADVAYAFVDPRIRYQ